MQAWLGGSSTCGGGGGGDGDGGGGGSCSGDGSVNGGGGLDIRSWLSGGGGGGCCSFCMPGDFSPLPFYAQDACLATSKAADPQVPCLIEPYPTGSISGAGT